MNQKYKEQSLYNPTTSYDCAVENQVQIKRLKVKMVHIVNKNTERNILIFTH